MTTAPFSRQSPTEPSRRSLPGAAAHARRGLRVSAPASSAREAERPAKATRDRPVVAPRAAGPLRGFVRRHPITVFLLLVFGVYFPVVGLPRLAGHSIAPELLDPVLSVLAFVLLFGSAVLVTAVADGRPGVRRLLAGIVRWRIGTARWLLAVGALPALTLIIAAATGTLRRPSEGWLQMSVTYLVTGIIAGALLTNLWEEAAWAGFVQHRLMTRHGLLAGSLLAAVPFALIHVPGSFQNTPAGEAVLNLVVLAVLAPFVRYLFGTVFLDTGGSIVAVGVLHASLNAVGKLSAVDGGWQSLPAMLVLILAVGAHYRLRRPSRPTGSRAGGAVARRPDV